MKTILLRSRFFAFVFLIVNLFFSNLALGQIVTLDQADLDYAPGETVYITGSGWHPGETVMLEVANLTNPDVDCGPVIPQPHESWTTIADENGNFTASWYVNDCELGADLMLGALGQESGFTYEVFFTDADPITITGAFCNGSPTSNFFLTSPSTASNIKCIRLEFTDLPPDVTITNVSTGGLPSGWSGTTGGTSTNISTSGSALPIGTSYSFLVTFSSSTGGLYSVLYKSGSGCPSNTNGGNSATISSVGIVNPPIAVNFSGSYDGTSHVGSATVGSGEVVDWYTAATGNTPSTAPSGTNVGTYTAYAEARNTTTGCKSATRTLVTVAINKATPTATLAVNNSPVAYTGLGQSATVGISASSVSGTVSTILTRGFATQTAAGTYAVTASFVPDDSANYNTLTGLSAGDFVINKATPTATLAVNNSPVTYTGLGQSATVGISASSVSGTVSTILTGGSATQTAAGTYAVTASFVPDDSANYNTLTGLSAGDFVINKATPTATLAVSNSPVTYTGSGQSATVGISASSVSGTVSTILTGGSATQTSAGTYAVTASFVPTDSANYNTLTGLSAENFVINKAPSITTVTVAAGPHIYTGSAIAPASVTVTGAGGLSLTPDPVYTNNINAGTANASYSYAGDANHEPSSDSEDFTIGKAASVTAITITGAPFTYTGSAITPATVSVTGAGGLSLTPDPVYTNNINAGTANASYSYAGDANHEPSSDSEDFTIDKAASLTVVTITGAPFTYTGSAITPATVSVTGAGGLNLTPAPVYTDNINAGTANASYSYAGDANHEPSSDSEDFTIDKVASLTVVTITGAPFTYTGSAITPATVSVTGAGGLNLTPAPVYTDNINAGTANASYSYAGDANHEPSSDSEDFTIGKAASVTAITITGAPFTYTGSAITPATVSVTGAGGLSLTPDPVYTDNINAGTANASYSYAGDANHEPSSDSEDFTIDKAASLTVVTITGAPFTYTGSAITPATVSVTGAGGLNLTPAPVYTDNINAGTANASYSYAGDANHEPSSDSEDFTIDKAASLTVVTITGAPFTYTGSAITPATVSVTGAGGLNLTPAPVYTDNINAGTANASYSYAGDANHEPSSDSESFIINKRAITITADAKFKCYGANDPVLTAQLTSGTIVPGDSATGSLVRNTGETAGVYTINKGSYTYGANYDETYFSANLTINGQITATFTRTNPNHYFGLSGNQTSKITVVPSGGVGPYTVSITMDRALISNYITNNGDESWVSDVIAVPGTITSTNVVLPSSGTLPTNSYPLTVATNVIDSYSITVGLLADAGFTATVTDSKGCIVTTEKIFIHGEDVRCFAGKSGVVKVKLCHKTGNTKNPCQELCVDESAVAAHLAHSDFLGTCTSNCQPPVLLTKSSLTNKDKAMEVEVETNPFSVIAYPNPSSSQFSVVVNSESHEKVEVLVYDMLARLIKRVEKPSDENILFGEDLPSGEYLILVSQGENRKSVNVIKK